MPLPDPPERRFTAAQIRHVLALRARLLESVRRFFSSRGYLEVSVPVLGVAADPAPTIEPMRTRLRLWDGSSRELYLQTSPEFFLKRLLAAGAERIFSIGPFFRDGEVTDRHNPEFFGLEWYCAGQAFHQMLDFCEEMFREVTLDVAGKVRLERCGIGFGVDRPFLRLSVAQALRELAGVEVPEDWGEDSLRRALRQAGVAMGADDDVDDMVNRVLIERVEPALARLGPVMLHDYPMPMAALARSRPENPAVAERFELFAGGIELCNGYGELVDPAEQRRRFLAHVEIRRRLGRPAVPIDEALLKAMEDGLPACCGCALGLDRWLMLLCGAERIDEVMVFPLSLELGRAPDGATGSV